MQRHVKLALVGVAAGLFVLVSNQLAWGDDPQVKKKMNQWKGELGVKCDYCHVVNGRKFDYEAKTPKKEVAHYCEENFVKKLMTATGKKVSCRDCHEGKPRFLPHPEGEREQAPPVAGKDEDEGKGGEDEKEEHEEKEEGRKGR